MRKAALQLADALLEFNPFGTFLALEPMQASLQEHKQRLQVMHKAGCGSCVHNLLYIIVSLTAKEQSPAGVAGLLPMQHNTQEAGECVMSLYVLTPDLRWQQKLTKLVCCSGAGAWG